MSNECKNILGVKWEKKSSRCQMGVNIFYISNGCKKLFFCEMGVKKI